MKISQRTPAFSVQRGFTLIELLVVIAIIAILAGMLLPSLGKAKVRAQNLQCMNNLRQVMLAWQLYAEDNRGTLPFNTVFETDLTRSWCTGFLSYNQPNPDNTNTLLFTKALLARISGGPPDSSNAPATGRSTRLDGHLGSGASR